MQTQLMNFNPLPASGSPIGEPHEQTYAPETITAFVMNYSFDLSFQLAFALQSNTEQLQWHDFTSDSKCSQRLSELPKGFYFPMLHQMVLVSTWHSSDSKISISEQCSFNHTTAFHLFSRAALSGNCCQLDQNCQLESNQCWQKSTFQIRKLKGVLFTAAKKNQRFQLLSYRCLHK